VSNHYIKFKHSRYAITPDLQSYKSLKLNKKGFGNRSLYNN